MLPQVIFQQLFQLLDLLVNESDVLRELLAHQRRAGTLQAIDLLLSRLLSGGAEFSTNTIE